MQQFLLLPTLLLLSFILTSFNTNNQTLKNELIYDVFSDGENIGELRAVSLQDGQSQEYELKTRVNYKILFKNIQFDNLINSRYKNDVLETASSVDHLNEKLRTKNQLSRSPNTGKYEVRKDDSKKTTALEENNIRYCLASLYFNEPKDIHEVFSHRLASLIPVKEVEPQKYAVQIASNKTNYYRFKNGICVEVEVNHWFADFTFKLRQ